MSRKIGIVFSYLLIIAEVLFSIVFTPYIIRTLGQAEYGVYKLNETVSTYLLLLDLGMGQAVIRWIAKYRAKDDKENASKFLGVVIVFYSLIAIVAILLGQVLVAVSPRFFAVGLTASQIDLFKKLLQITIINVAYTLATVPFNNTVIGYERFAFSKSISILQIIARVICYYIALTINLGGVGLVLSQLVITILGRTIIVWYVLFVLKLKPVFWGASKNDILEIVKYTSLFFILVISTQVNNTLDNLLLGSLVQDAASIVAVYSVALQLTFYFNAIGDGMTGVLMPGIVKLVENGAEDEALFNEMIRLGRLVLSFCMLLAVGYIVCGKRFIQLWVGNDYSLAYYIALPLIIIYMFMHSQGIGDDILNAKNKIKEIAILRLGVMIINIFISLLLIQWNPMFGCMIGTFFSLLLGGVIAKNYVFKLHIHISIKDYTYCLLKGILPCSICASLIGLTINAIIPAGIIGFLCMTIIITSIYSLLVWIWGYNENEKKYIRGILRGLIEKVLCIRE